MNQTYNQGMQACYWGYFLFNKWQEDPTYKLPVPIKYLLTDLVADSNNFLKIIKGTFTPIEYIKYSNDLTTLKQMENDGIITSDEALEIFGVEL